MLILSLSDIGLKSDFWVKSFHVCLYIIALSGPVITIGAGIGLLSRVDPLMPSEIGAITSLVAALITKEFLPI